MTDNTDTGDTTTITISDQIIRGDLIEKAVFFLQNPNIRRCSLDQKQNFLRKKGLNEKEIQIACERAGVFTDDPGQLPGDTTYVNIDRYPNNYAVQPSSTLSKLKEYLSTISLFSGVAYLVYLFYKRFIAPIFFRQKKRKTLDESIGEVIKKVETNCDDLKTEVKNLRQEIKDSKAAEKVAQDLQNFKNDLEAIKGLLLNRKQFSSPMPSISAVPSIPAWQKVQKERKTSDNSDKNDEIGSGSGSSETEVVPLDQNQW